jgi:hypothetical protein
MEPQQQYEAPPQNFLHEPERSRPRSFLMTTSNSSATYSAHLPSAFCDDSSRLAQFQQLSSVVAANPALGSAFPFSPSPPFTQQQQELLMLRVNNNGLGLGPAAARSAGGMMMSAVSYPASNGGSDPTSYGISRAQQQQQQQQHRQRAAATLAHTLDQFPEELEDFDPLPLNAGPSGDAGIGSSLGVFGSASSANHSMQSFASAPPPSSVSRHSSVSSYSVATKDEEQSGNVASKPSILGTSSLLHNSCKLYPDTLFIVESALRMDPNSIRQKVNVTSTATSSVDEAIEASKEAPSSSSFRSLSKAGRGGESAPSLFKKRKVTEAFGYPINIALKRNASDDVIDLLIREGPDVLSLPDGPDDTSTLTIAIELGKSHDVLKRIIKANPNVVHTRDKYDNLPLHSLLQSRAGPLIESVKMVYRAYPQGLRSVNFHGHTPLDLAVRNESCGEHVLNFLHSVEFKDQEDRANHLDDLVD